VSECVQVKVSDICQLGKNVGVGNRESERERERENERG